MTPVSKGAQGNLVPERALLELCTWRVRDEESKHGISDAPPLWRNIAHVSMRKVDRLHGALLY